MSSQDPLTLLRKFIIEKKEIKLREDKLIMGKYEVPLQTPTAWQPRNSEKSYNYKLGDLWLYLINNKAIREEAEPTDYYAQLKQLGSKYNLQVVQVHHRGGLQLLQRK